MTTARQAPTMPVDASSERFALSADPIIERRLWSRLDVVRRVMARSKWTDRDTMRLDRIAGRFWDQPFDSEAYQMCHSVADAVQAWRHLDDISRGLDGAALRNALCRPGRKFRAQAIRRKLDDKIKSRKVEIARDLEKYKTYAVRARRQALIETTDPRLLRLLASVARLKRLRPEMQDLWSY